MPSIQLIAPEKIIKFETSSRLLLEISILWAAGKTEIAHSIIGETSGVNPSAWRLNKNPAKPTNRRIIIKRMKYPSNNGR